MMKIWKSVIAAPAMSLLLVGMYGCHEGPAERAGEKIDKTVDQAGQQMEKAGKKIQDDIKGE
jgi:hypothetical protein